MRDSKGSEEREFWEVSIERTGRHPLATEPAFLHLRERGWSIDSVFLVSGLPARYRLRLYRQADPNKA